MKIRYEEGVDLKNQYVIIANHFSYIDIPALAALNIPFKFIGKMQVNNIPVLGYIFKNLHIMVDRDSKESRKQTYPWLFKRLYNREVNMFEFFVVILLSYIAIKLYDIDNNNNKPGF